MNKDDKHRLYVAHTTGTRTWVHDDIFPKLEEYFEIIDPFRDRRKQYKGLSDEGIKDMLKDLHTARWVVDHDLGDIATCDALLLINAEGPSYGSVLELSYAVREVEIPAVAVVLEKYLWHPWLKHYCITVTDDIDKGIVSLLNFFGLSDNVW